MGLAVRPFDTNEAELASVGEDGQLVLLRLERAAVLAHAGAWLPWRGGIGPVVCRLPQSGVVRTA